MFGRVEMKVVLMKAVCVGTKNGSKGSAGGFVRLAHDFAVFAVPTLQNRDGAAVVEGQARDIDGLSFAVFRDFSARLIVPRAAGIMRGNF